MRRILFIGFGVGAVLTFLLLFSRESEAPGISETDLGKLVNRSHVVWEDYGEDIKAAVGATPAAQWHGEPSEIRLADGAIEVNFDLHGAWTAYSFGMPILLRTPEGEVVTSSGYTRNERGGVYTFRHPEPLDAVSTPWVELRFPPNEERRFVFDTKGVWHKAEKN